MESSAIRDKQIVIDLPEDLIERVKTATTDIYRFVERALNHESSLSDAPLTIAEKEALLCSIFPPERNAGALQLFRVWLADMGDKSKCPPEWHG